MFGRSLRALRKDGNRSAEEIGEFLDVSADSIYKYERGDRDPSIYNLVRLALLFGVSLDRLVYGREARPRLMKITSIEPDD